MKERLELEQLVSVGRAAARKLTHARILLLADERLGEAYAEAEIVSALGTSPRTIERLRKRCVTEGLEAALDHRPQPPRPDKVQSKGHVGQQLCALACSEPPRGRCHWTFPLLDNCWPTNSSSWAWSILSSWTKIFIHIIILILI